LLAGFERPTGGRIEMEGRSIEGEPAWRRNIGMVFQDYALFPHMTVRENVAFPLSVRKMSKDEMTRKVDAALDMVQLKGFADRRPNQLSGGQQQRVALTRAIVFAPRVVLMDEPLGALDKQLREQMQLEIKRLQQELGVTVVYVTHDQAEALVMSDRIAVFSKGRICQLDTPAELYEHPQDTFVAQFIGENNQLKGKIVAFGRGCAQVELTGGVRIIATPVNANTVGMPVALSLRPERIAIGADEETKDNHFRAVLRGMVYLGDHLRLFLAISGYPIELVAKVAITKRRVALEPGAELDVSWSAADCHALPIS
jgi:putative spermidine/putrescine transport system ATP-binding protein